MNIIVTGTSRGIGYEIVKSLSVDSANNIIAISRNKDKLEQLKNECLQVNSSAKISILPFDLSNPFLKEDIIPNILNHFKSIDILINNAGTLINKLFEAITEKELNYIYNVNVFSTIKLIQFLLPHMGKLSHTHIVNIGSMGGFQGSTKFSGLSVYSSSKAAIANLSECLAEEFKEKNISVNCLALGAVQTEMLNEAFPGFKTQVTAMQMAEFIVNFSINGHKYFNGKVLPISLSTP